MILRKDDLEKSGQALTKSLKGKIASETGSTMKTSGVSIYRKSDIAEAKVTLQLQLTQSSSKSPSAEPRKNLQKISSQERLEESFADEELQRLAHQADLSFPAEGFQQSHKIVTSKDTSWVLNFAIERAKPNKGGPGSSCRPKTQEEVVLKKSEKKKKTAKRKSCNGSQSIRRKKKEKLTKKRNPV